MSRRPAKRRGTAHKRRKGAAATGRAAAAAGAHTAGTGRMRRPMAIGALALVAAGIVGYWVWAANQPAGSGAPLASVVVPTLAGAALEGEAAFETYCQRCHGENAAGKDGFGPPLVHRIYVPGHHSDAAFFSAAANGARAHHWGFGDMPPVEGISAAEVEVVVAYVRALQRANGIR